MITSNTVAYCAGTEHKKVLETIAEYSKALETFGKLSEMNGIYNLSEEQAILVYLRIKHPQTDLRELMRQIPTLTKAFKIELAKVKL